jgi:hypothetical protein
MCIVVYLKILPCSLTIVNCKSGFLPVCGYERWGIFIYLLLLLLSVSCWHLTCLVNAGVRQGQSLAAIIIFQILILFHINFILYILKRPAQLGPILHWLFIFFK